MSNAKSSIAAARPAYTRLRGSPAQRRLWFLLPAALCLCARAQTTNYSAGWHTVDGGAGTSTGGVYTVVGTLGQHDAGRPLTNGSYAVTGGFWALPRAVQMPGAPVLTIAPSGAGQATISWTPDAPGWILQETIDLRTTSWLDAPSGTNNPAIVPATLPVKFYRLFKP